MRKQFCETCIHNNVCGAYKSETNITEYEILKQEENFCNTIWDSTPCKMHDNGVPYRNLWHDHMCDFEILNFRYCKNRKQLDKLVEKKCKAYLASIGKERDECMWCCDECIHSRYLTISCETEDLILNIATLRLDSRKLESDVNGKDIDRQD